jgi:deoxyribonuclease V
MTSAEWSWAAAVALDDRGPVAESVVRGRTGAGYRAGYLALREGPLLDESIRSLGVEPDVVLVNATGLDHPRGAGLALHLGAVVGIPTVGVTDRPLLSGGPPPGPERFATSPLFIDGKQVAAYLRSRRGARPIVVHPAWRTDVRTAIEVVGAFVWRARTPEPLRLARRAARLARARDEGRLS